MRSILSEKDVFVKLGRVEEDGHRALLEPQLFFIPQLPGRSIDVLPINKMPKKVGLSTLVGQRKLLHDLANIELQAMELGFRTLVEFPWAAPSFREELLSIVLEEAKHLQLCLQGIESLGGHWGEWPVHLGLWAAVDAKDTLLERIFIVHRYLESSGLDAGDTILRRLSGIRSRVVAEIVKVIVDEEVGHVSFGSRWFQYYCSEQEVRSEKFFYDKTKKILLKNPRYDKLCIPLRQQGGYTPNELELLREARNS